MCLRRWRFNVQAEVVGRLAIRMNVGFGYTFDSESVHDVPTRLVQTHEQDANGNVAQGRALPLR